MDVKVENLGPCRKKVAVTIPVEAVKEEYDRQFQEINDTIVYPGFRRGHAPRSLLQKRFATSLGKEVKEKLVQGAIEKMVEDKTLAPIEPPQVDLESLEVDEEEPFGFDFEVLTKPEFETPTWKGLAIEAEPIAVSETEVEAAVEDLRRREARLHTVEDAEVAEGDVLILDWRARDGDSIVAQDDNAYAVCGRGVIGGFVAEQVDQALRAQKAGAKAEQAVTVVEDDPREELRGKELQLEVTLKSIQRPVLPEIDQAFLRKYDFDDVEELREDVGKHLRRGAERARNRQIEADLLDRLIDGVEISLPEEYVERELAHWAQRRRSEAEMESVETDEIQKKLDAERKDAKTAVEKDMRIYFLLDRIAEEEDLRVADKEVLQVIQGIAQAYGRPEEEVLASYRDRGRISELRDQIRHRKARELIRRHAEVTEKEKA